MVATGMRFGEGSMHDYGEGSIYDNISNQKSDYAYYVSRDEIKLEEFNEYLESDTIIELLPIDVVEEEKYWKFNIFVIFPDTGLYKINASLSGKYLDKDYPSYFLYTLLILLWTGLHH